MLVFEGVARMNGPTVLRQGRDYKNGLVFPVILIQLRGAVFRDFHDQ